MEINMQNEEYQEVLAILEEMQNMRNDKELVEALSMNAATGHTPEHMRIRVAQSHILIKRLCKITGKTQEELFDDNFRGLTGYLESFTNPSGYIEKIYYQSGKLKKETPYKAGKIDGLQRGYFENGKLKWETPMKAGKAEGIEKVYYDNGKLQEEALFKDDKKILETVKKYSEDGRLISE